jgi:antitoxin FitA
MAKKTSKPESKSPDVESKGSLKDRLARPNRLLPKESAEERIARIDATLDRMTAEANSPGRGSPQFIVRYPDEAMRAKIARLAKKNNRSINAEIIDRLQKSMIDDAIHNLEESMGEIFDRVEKLESKVSDHDERLNIRHDD